MNDNKLNVTATNVANIALYGIIACLGIICFVGAKFGISGVVLLQNALIVVVYVFCICMPIIQYLGDNSKNVLLRVTALALLSIIVSVISGFYYIVIFELLFYIIFVMAVALLKSNIDAKKVIADSEKKVVETAVNDTAAKNMPTIADVLAQNNRALLGLITDAQNMEIDNIVEVKLKAYSSILCNFYITKDISFGQMSKSVAKECADILELYGDLRSIDDKSDNLEVLQRIIDIDTRVWF